MSKQKVELLRHSIDECDEALIRLLQKRQQCVDELVSHKRDTGEALFVPEREAHILQKIGRKAEQAGVDPSLAQDLLQRIMRDSYTRQAHMQYASATDGAKSICVIGGKGQLGSLFVEQFLRSGHQVKVLERDDWPQAQDSLADCDLVLVAVPIFNTPDVIQQLTHLSAKTLLADITSIKSQPLQQMLKVHSGPVIGLHPMFGPGLSHMARQLMLYTPGRDNEKSQWLLEQFKLWGCQLQQVEAAEHDKVMSIVQALRHFVTFIAGWQLMESETDIQQLMNMSSPIYRMELAIIGRLFAQDPELYVDILLNASHGHQVLEQYAAVYQQALGWMKQAKREQLIEKFTQVAQYFGQWKQDFYHQSDTLLEAFRERL